jgi:hypothetical protein
MQEKHVSKHTFVYAASTRTDCSSCGRQQQSKPDRCAGDHYVSSAAADRVAVAVIEATGDTSSECMLMLNNQLLDVQQQAAGDLACVRPVA